MDELGSVMPTEEEEEAPSITEFHSSTHVLPVGQTARYTCHAGGTPEPTVEWLHNGRPLERYSTVNQSEAWVERGFLFVRGRRYGVNTVCCMASNSAGTANHSAELLVFDACDLTLDPNTAYRRLSLSEDNRKVTRVRGNQSYRDHPERFDSRYQVFGREALTGQCYWEVEWEGYVGIGVTDRGITRRGRGGDSRLGRYNNSWVLHCSDGGYYARYRDSPRSPPRWLHQSRSVSGPACWLSVLLQSFPRWRRVLRHTDTHPHLLVLLHPGGPPRGGGGGEVSVSVSVVERERGQQEPPSPGGGVLVSVSLRLRPSVKKWGGG